MSQMIDEETKWIAIARARDLPLREGRVVMLGDREVAVFNLGTRVLAVANRCPHKNGPLADGILSGSTVVCPLHAWKFDLETGKGSNSISAEHCVQTVQSRIRDGILFLAVPRRSATNNKMPGTVLEHADGDPWKASSANSQ
jgi:nitrite reductase (NADH) small subunit